MAATTLPLLRLAAVRPSLAAVRPCLAGSIGPAMLVAGRRNKSGRDTGSKKSPSKKKPPGPRPSRAKNTLYCRLNTNVPGLGWAGRVLPVPPGMFTMVLQPNKWARYATTEEIAEAKRGDETKADDNDLHQEQELVSRVTKKLGSKRLSFNRPAGAPFSVTLPDVINAIHSQMNLVVNPDAVVFPKNITTHGDFAVQVHVDDETLVDVGCTVLNKTDLGQLEMDRKARDWEAGLQ